MLERIAAAVEPLMRRRGWSVQRLEEMVPRQQGLLGMNVNRGAKILLKLRDAGAFLPFEQTLDTMLHELVHMEIGPHNASFYQMWDQLRDECERDFAASGRKPNPSDPYSSTTSVIAFSGEGRRLGGNLKQPASATGLRAAARMAAERRLGVGGRRLGGAVGDGRSDLGTGLTPKERARAAAERRRQKQCTCIALEDGHDRDQELDGDIDLSVTEEGERSKVGQVLAGSSSTDVPENGVKEARINAGEKRTQEKKRPRESLNTGLENSLNAEVVEIDVSCKQGSGKGLRPVSSSSFLSKSNNNIEISAHNGIKTVQQDNAKRRRSNPTVRRNHAKDVLNKAWGCPTCTYINAETPHRSCTACGEQRPSESYLWTCIFCGLENSIDAAKCLRCSSKKPRRVKPSGFVDLT